MSSWYFDTSISPSCRHDGFRQCATRRSTPRWRILPRVIGSPGGCLGISSSPRVLPALLQELLATFSRFLAVLTNAEPAKLRIVSGVLRAVYHRPFGLKPMQSYSLPPLALFVFVPLLPRL